MKEGWCEVQSVGGVTGACAVSIVVGERREGRSPTADKDDERVVRDTGDSGIGVDTEDVIVALPQEKLEDL